MSVSTSPQPLHTDDAYDTHATNTHPELRPLYCPFASAINPKADTVQCESVAWAQRMGLVSSSRQIGRLEKSKIGYLVSRALPRGEQHALQIAADWTTVFCLLDDRIEEIGDSDRVAELSARWLVAFQTGRISSFTDSDPIERSLVDLCQRMTAASSPEWVEGFSECLSDILSGMIWESVNRHHDLHLDESAYRALREITVGLYPQFLLGILAEGLYLPREILQHPVIRRLMTASSLAVGWANDIFTCEKELEAGERHNIVFVIMREDGLQFSQALHWASSMHDAEVHAFETLAQDLPSFGVYQGQVLRFVAILADWIRGHLDWAVETGRYAPVADSGDSGAFSCPTPVSSEQLFAEAM